MKFSVDSVTSQRERFDLVLLSTMFALIALGLGMLWSASWFRADQLYGEPLRFFMRQGLWVLMGLAVGLVCLFVPLDAIRKALPIAILVSLAIALLTFVPGISARYMGARRWIIVFNVSFQPSELLKLASVVYLAHFLSERAGDFSDPLPSIAAPLVIVGLLVLIVLLQNDFSTAVFLATLSLSMFFVSGVPMKHFIRTFAVGAPLAFLALFRREHRVRRIIAFLNPEFDPAGSGFQVLAARRALEQGGIWGTGIGQGERKLGGLPEAHSDFLFAVLGEELGLAGVVVVLGLFLVFAVRGMYLARRHHDAFRSLLVFGLTMSISLQALLNIAVVAGVVPATGIPLPFFSAGGSSMLVTAAMCGLLLNAARLSAPGAAQDAADGRIVAPRIWEGYHG